MNCWTCGGEVGEHFGQCPEGSEPLPWELALWESNARRAGDVLREALEASSFRLELVREEVKLIQESLF